MFEVSNCKLLGYIRYFPGVAKVDARATQERQKNERQFHCLVSVLFIRRVINLRCCFARRR